MVQPAGFPSLRTGAKHGVVTLVTLLVATHVDRERPRVEVTVAEVERDPVPAPKSRQRAAKVIA